MNRKMKCCRKRSSVSACDCTEHGASTLPPPAGRRRVARALLAGAVALGLAACAGPARIAGDGTAFERTGRFAVTVTDAGSPADAVQGGFSWRDTGRLLQLDLVNPLGSTLARVSVGPAGATLQHADGSTEQAPDADALVARATGAALPVAKLRDWLRGQTGSGAPGDVERDAEGRLQSFAQDGWRVQLSRYDALGPGLLRLERRDGTRRISVRLAVDTQAAR